MQSNTFKLISRSILKLLLLAVAVSALSFFLLVESPIDPVATYVGSDNTISAEQRQEIAEYWGVNDPPLERYGSWLKSLAHGDFGVSSIYRRPVIDVIKERFIVSLPVMLISWILSGIFAVALGIWAAVKRGTWIDKLIKGYCILTASSPTFWLGMLLLMIFAVWLGVLPFGLASTSGVLSADITLGDKLVHMILPVLVLSITGISSLALQTREKMVTILESEYVIFAKARGESMRNIIWRHGLPNVLVPVVTLQFGSLGELFGGSVLVETVFSYPGLGSTTTAAGLSGDMALLLGIAVISVIFIFIGNLTANILYPILDPSILNTKGHGAAKSA